MAGQPRASDMSWYTWQWYGDLLDLIQDNGYSFADYFDFADFQRPCILRHDVDYSLERALDMARFEASMDLHQKVHSTYFVLLNSEFYNPRSSQSKAIFSEIADLGHHIGLHFDTTVYGDDLSKAEFVQQVQEEAEVLSKLARTEIRTMSMHRPSQEILDADIEISGIVNTYGDFFFRQFSYVSDSGLYWRQDPRQLIGSGEAERLHILTHPVWYSERAEQLKEKLLAIGDRAGIETLKRFGAEVYTHFFDVVPEEEIRCHFHSPSC